MDFGYKGFAQVYDLLTDDISYPKRAAYFDHFIQAYHNKRALLLDLACGTGSLTEEFSRMGYDVVGVDASAEMLTFANQKKMDNGSNTIYLCQAMQRLDLFGTVDVAVCALDSLNHLTRTEDVQTTLDRVALFLNPNGLFVFDVNTVYKHEHVLANHTFVYEYRDVYLVWQNTLLQDAVVQIDLDIFHGEQADGYRRYSESFLERAYSIEQIGSFLNKAGFRILHVYHQDTLTRPREDSERVTFVTMKG